MDAGRYKAHLVAQGYSQKGRVDYTKTFALVARFNSLPSILALVSENAWELEEMDVTTAFLHGQLEEKVFMDIPEGLHTDVTKTAMSSGIVCELKKSIDGLKQSPGSWYGEINRIFSNHSFKRTEQDHNFYIHQIFSLIRLLYVDHLVLTSPSMDEIFWIQDLLHREFKMRDLSPHISFLGIGRRRDRRVRRLHLSQQRYRETILARYGRADSTPVVTGTGYCMVSSIV